MKEFVLWTLSLYPKPTHIQTPTRLPTQKGIWRSFTEITHKNIETLWAAREGLSENSFLHCRHITYLFKQAEGPSH